MADDDAYTAFLNKAAADAQPAGTSVAKSPRSSTVTTADVHPALSSLPAERVYVSDADEPFRPVSIPTKSAALDAESVTAAIKDATGKAVAGLEALSVSDWDPRGEYKDVVRAVAEAAGCKDGDVAVFRAAEGGARVDYWVLGLHGGDKVLRGFVATGVES